MKGKSTSGLNGRTLKITKSNHDTVIVPKASISIRPFKSCTEQAKQPVSQINGHRVSVVLKLCMFSAPNVRNHRHLKGQFITKSENKCFLFLKVFFCFFCVLLDCFGVSHQHFWIYHLQRCPPSLSHYGIRWHSTCGQEINKTQQQCLFSINPQALLWAASGTIFPSQCRRIYSWRRG